MIRAEEKDTVKVRYIGRLENGTIFDQSPEEAPLQFILGCQEVISGFDEAVLGMFQGESKKVVIPCEKAYGLSKPELIEKVAKDLLEGKVDLIEGSQLEITRDDGSVFHVFVNDIQEKHVVLDANHPLAGKNLTFEIQLIEVKKNKSY